MPDEIVAKKNLSRPRTYEELRERVRATLAGGRERARKILEKIQSRMFWETGRLIHFYLKHEKKISGRAPYGEKVVVMLASDLSYDKAWLYDSLRVYRNDPIFSTLRKLSVSHHRQLLFVKDEAQRKALAAAAEKNGWTARELFRKIRGFKSLSDGRKQAPRLRARKGKLRHYQIVERNGQFFVDLGFRDFRKLSEPGDFRDGDIVEGFSLERLIKKSEATRADLYTYRAELLHFPDADTYWLFIDKGFGGFREDKIRLRGINAPEISAVEGEEAKKFVEGIFGRSPAAAVPVAEVLVTTAKTPDKWDRYLADLYFEKGGQEIYLNRLLLEEGHAALYDKE